MSLAAKVEGGIARKKAVLVGGRERETEPPLLAAVARSMKTGLACLRREKEEEIMEKREKRREEE